jgi:hypothetical protein
MKFIHLHIYNSSRIPKAREIEGNFMKTFLYIKEKNLHKFPFIFADCLYSIVDQIC